MGFISHVCEKYNIKVLPLRAAGLEGTTKGDGFAFSPDVGKNLVLYDDTAGKIERNYIVLHEIGHILLGHLYNAVDTHTKEMEASIFAAVILAHMLYGEYEKELKKAPATDQSTQGAKES